MALYGTCMPLPSDTFHDDKLFACNQGDDADYDHDHEEGLWLSMQPLCLCRRTCFMIISSLHVTMVMTVKICYDLNVSNTNVDSKGYDEMCQTAEA